MEEKDKKDSEEYKKRIKDLIDRVEKSKDKGTNIDGPITYQLLIEKVEQVKQKAISKIDPEFRDEKLIVVFVYMIREYYWLRADPRYPNEPDQFLDEIDDLYRLIYAELKKLSLFTIHYSPEERKRIEKIQKRRIVNKMTQILGMENISNDFYKNYNVNDLILKETYMKEVGIFVFVFVIILFIIFIFIL